MRDFALKEAIDAPVESAETNDTAEANDALDGVSDAPVLTDTERVEIIQELLKESDINNAEKWEKLTAIERAKILKDLGDEIAAKTGLDKIPISFRDDMAANVLGSYDTIRRNININISQIADAEARLDAAETLCHELRHAFQQQAMLNPEKYGISQELADEWRYNFDNYKTVEMFGYRAYYEQALERDAFAHGEQCRRVLE